MNLTEEEEQDLLDRLSHEKAVELIPVSVYVMVMMLAGLCGNVIVCVFYNTRARVTPTTRLIVAVAVIDTVICILMPKNVADLALSYKFTSSALCKLNNFVNHTSALSSAFVLIAVAAFRFRAVCRPFSSQFSLRHANISIVIAVVAAVVVSIPVFVTHESVPISLRVNASLKITGYDCNTSKKPSRKGVNLFVNVLHFFLFISTTSTFIALYGKMGYAIMKYYKRKKVLTANAHSASDYTSKSIDESESSHIKTEMDEYHDDSVVDDSSDDDGVQTKMENENGMNDTTADISCVDISLNETHRIDTKNAEFNADITNGETQAHAEHNHAHAEHNHAHVHFDKDAKTEEHVKNSPVGANKQEEHAIPIVAIRQTAMLFFITLIFIVSFLPYIIMNIARTLSKNKDGDADFTNFIQFCTRSYLINSAANPFVYGLFTSDLRAFVMKKLCRCCPK